MAKKNRTFIVRNLGDMVKLENINNAVLEKQIKKLKTGSILTKAAGIYMLYKIYQQGEELYRQSIRIKNLENEKGE